MYDPHLGGGGVDEALLKAISFGFPLFLNLSLVRLGKVQKFIFGRIVGWGGASLYIVFVVVSPLRYEVASSVALDPFMSFSLSFLLSSSIFPFSPHC